MSEVVHVEDFDLKIKANNNNKINDFHQMQVKTYSKNPIIGAFMRKPANTPYLSDYFVKIFTLNTEILFYYITNFTSKYQLILLFFM